VVAEKVVGEVDQNLARFIVHKRARLRQPTSKTI
jgi:hypothetical protein